MTTAIKRRLDHLERLLTVAAEEQVELLGVVMPRSTLERALKAAQGTTITPISHPQLARDIPHHA